MKNNSLFLGSFFILLGVISFARPVAAHAPGENPTLNDESPSGRNPGSAISRGEFIAEQPRQLKYVESRITAEQSLTSDKVREGIKELNDRVADLKLSIQIKQKALEEAKKIEQLHAQLYPIMTKLLANASRPLKQIKNYDFYEDLESLSELDKKFGTNYYGELGVLPLIEVMSRIDTDFAMFTLEPLKAYLSSLTEISGATLAAASTVIQNSTNAIEAYEEEIKILQNSVYGTIQRKMEAKGLITNKKAPKEYMKELGDYKSDVEYLNTIGKYKPTPSKVDSKPK